MKKPLINKLGLLGPISFISYAVAVILSPLAYPGYNWMARAVSDLSAADAPSLGLWTQLTALYGLCAVTCITLVSIYITGRMTKGLRIGIYLFATMQWISAIGYTMFPLSSSDLSLDAADVTDAVSGMLSSFQDIMHIVVTVFVVVLSIVSLIFILVSGFRGRNNVSLAIFASIALIFMMVGGIGVGIVPSEVVGIFERFSVFSATGFNAILGIYLFLERYEVNDKG